MNESTPFARALALVTKDTLPPAFAAPSPQIGLLGILPVLKRKEAMTTILQIARLRINTERQMEDWPRAH